MLSFYESGILVGARQKLHKWPAPNETLLTEFLLASLGNIHAYCHIASGRSKPNLWDYSERVLGSSSLVSADFTLVPFWFPDFASYPLTVINHSCEATICWVLWVPLAKCQTWEWSWGPLTQIQNILISYGAIKHNIGVIFYTKQKPLTNQNHMSHLCHSAWCSSRLAGPLFRGLCCPDTVRQDY